MRAMEQNCKFCGSSKTVKNGMRKGVQIYKCKSCNHRYFDNSNSFVRMKTSSHIITTALNMYFDGLSVRKVVTQINEIFGMEFSQVTVWNWIQKYSKLVSEYVNTLQPKLSGKYHHDETEIKVDGNGRFFWEMIDEDTRFIVAHLLSNGRYSENAIEVFQQALQKQRPTVLFTDGSYSYDNAFRKVFGTRYKTDRVQWVRRVGIRARKTNNIIERLHGTLKDRYRPMRGLKKDTTAKNLLDGYVAYYNFCRRHQSIKMTPAQSAGIQIKGWKQLIENSQRQLTNTRIRENNALEIRVKIE